MMGRPKIDLPPLYYLDNFRYLLAFVERLYAGLFNQTEREFIRHFGVLSQDAQCLYVRFSNRKGRFFRPGKLTYPEIADLPAALQELLLNGFAEPLNAQHESLAADALGVFTKPELLKYLPFDAEEIRAVGKLKKEDLVQYARQELNFGAVVSALIAQESVVLARFETEVMMLKYLFFGNRGADMTEFVLRDMGMMNFERYDESAFSARFKTRKEVEDKLLISLTNEVFYELKAAEISAEIVYSWFLNWNDARPNLADIAQPGYERLVCRVGAYLERQKLPDQALIVFALTDQAPARERRARLLLKAGLIDEALALCHEIAETPQNADERYFADDFKNKILGLAEKKRPRKATTRFLADAETLAIPAGFRHHVEAGVINHYQQQGQYAAFAENYPWRGLFGLVFWDIIHDTSASVIHHPLQRAPSDFYAPDFYDKREERLKNRLAELTTTAQWQQHVGQVFSAKNGLTNNLVDWNEELLTLVNRIIERLEVAQLSLILLEMARNVAEHTRGFPDLLTWDNADGYEFVEVKSPTDHLGPQQLHWLAFFKTIGVQAKVVRVIWEM
jgi:VRR-NUC domain